MNFVIQDPVGEVLLLAQGIEQAAQRGTAGERTFAAVGAEAPEAKILDVGRTDLKS